jgi:hypothetical protein
VKQGLVLRTVELELSSLSKKYKNITEIQSERIKKNNEYQQRAEETF